MLAAMKSRIATMWPTSTPTGWSDAIRDKAYPEVSIPATTIAGVAIAMADTHEGAGRQARRRLRGEHGLRRWPRQAARRPDQGACGGIEYKYETLDRAGKDFLRR